MYSRILLLVLFSFLLQNCELFNLQEPLAIEGEWAWTEALDDDKKDLFQKHSYQTCSFFKDGTYEYSIDSTMLFGIYEVDENNTIVRLDHSDIWEIMNFSDSSFVLLNLNGSRHKWELKKVGTVSH